MISCTSYSSYEEPSSRPCNHESHHCRRSQSGRGQVSGRTRLYFADIRRTKPKRLISPMFPERGQNNNVRLLQSTTAVAIPVQLPAVLRNPRACNATPKSQVPFAFWCGVVGLRKSQSLADPLGRFGFHRKSIALAFLANQNQC